MAAIHAMIPARARLGTIALACACAGLASNANAEPRIKGLQLAQASSPALDHNSINSDPQRVSKGGRDARTPRA